MSQDNAKVGSKRTKRSNGVDLKTTVKISGTLHRYFSTKKIIIPDENEDKNDTSTSKSSTAKVQFKNVPPTSSDKLWPCFMRAKPLKENGSKKIEDEAKLRARTIFLESGTPEVLLKKKIKIDEDDLLLDRPIPFPSISHVTQITANNYVKEPTLALPPLRCSSTTLPHCPVWSSISVNELNEPEIEVFERTRNAKTILDELKEENSKTDVKALYKTLKMYKSETQSNLWTEIYKPLTTLDLLGNSEQIDKFKTWLDDLKKKKLTEAVESSGDEFVDEESDNETKNFSQNVAVIKGPCGSGKTSAVFAVANQLDCKVLEINTSSNRSGKRILGEFLESTQSHQVERVNMIEELSTIGKSRKRKRSKTAEDKKMEKTSLILVEEADLVFEDIDEGFTQAIFSLASSSKRPLILITNHNRNPHLERLKNSDLLELCFSRPRFEKLGMWLRLVGLVEGIVITRDQAARLVQWARGDVRRCLLQLQIMFLSNNSEVQEHVTVARLWWNWPLTRGLQYKLPTLSKSENDSVTAIVETVSKEEQLKRLQSVAASTSRLVSLDLLTSHSSLGGEAPCPVSWMAQSEDSVMLTEHREDRSDGKCLQELAEWLICSAHEKMATENPRSETSREGKWLSVLRQGEQLFLSGVSTSQLTAHDSLACDYLPALRTFGRCDQVRLPVYTRRTSRIFNYLQGLGINASKSFNDCMCDAFS